VGAVLVIVREIFSAESSQVLFAQGDYVIQHLSTTTTHPTLRDSVLPRGLRMLVRIGWMPLLVRKSRMPGLNFAS
jgi:hypothetical protein